MVPRTTFQSPFQSAGHTTAGHGEVVLAVLPPNNPTIVKQSYKYPLKLISRTPACQLNSKYPASATAPLHLYLLSFGGGLLPGDVLDVSITLQPRSRLVLTTPHGSTKIFRTDAKFSHASGRSKQILKVELGKQTGLCYLPDPAVPFKNSRYEQFQQFTLLHGDEQRNQSSGIEDDPASLPPSLCVLDWVTRGRAARGESWAFHEWTGRNEVWAQDVKTGKRKLLVRDSVILEDETLASNGTQSGSNTLAKGSILSDSPLPIAARTHPHGVLGTLILHGPLFESLGGLFMDEFVAQPRIGGKNWSSSESDEASQPKRNDSGVTWTAARVRQNFVLVKFAATEFETAKEWLTEILRRDGGIEREFGDEAFGIL